MTDVHILIVRKSPFKESNFKLEFDCDNDVELSKTKR